MPGRQEICRSRRINERKRNVANAIDNESDANAFGTDGADGSQAKAGNAADGGYLADNRDNADGSLQITGEKRKQWCSHGGIGYRYKWHSCRKTHCIAR